MSAIYKLRYKEGFEWLLPVDEEDFDQLRFDGTSRASSWKPVQMTRLLVSSQGKPLKPGNFYACSGGDMLVFDAKANEALRSEFDASGEVLPLACEGREYWTLNVTSVVDALDEASSSVMRASDTGGILMIRKHVFRGSALPDRGLFKLSQAPRGLIYATESFANAIAGNGLSGLELTAVWAPS